MADNSGWETWRWDESLFAGTAAYYLKGRPPYSPLLSSSIAAALDLDGCGRLLDVGCGPGIVALQLASLFESVVGLDPDADMLAAAARSAKDQAVTNANWVQLRAEELPGQLGTFRVVSFAASFHWMDRPRVAQAVKGMLEADGAVVQIDAPAYRPGDTRVAELPYPPPPQTVIDEMRIRYIGPDRRAGKGIRNTSPGDENAVFVAAGFLATETVIVPDGRVIVRTVDDLVANVFSTSSTAPGLLGDRLDEFESELRARLAEASPQRLYSVRLPDNELRIWRLPG